MRYNPALDGIRAVAVLLVIGYHVGVPNFGSGYLGVDVFFVLSGYLITSILRREDADGGIRLGAFYLRRARRLYPALCVLVCALLAVGWANVRGAGIALLYLSDYVPGSGAMAHLWSLAVEEHYYMLWPLLLPFVVRTKRHVWLLLAAYVASSAWFMVATHDAPTAAALRFDTRLSGLLFGSLLAFLPATSLLPFGLLLACTVGMGFGLPLDRAFAEMATASFILLSAQVTIPWITRQPFVYLGRISYGLYLFHAPLAFYFSGDMGWQAEMAATLAVTIAASMLSYHTVEAWFRKPRQLSGNAAGGVKVVPEG